MNAMRRFFDAAARDFDSPATPLMFYAGRGANQLEAEIARKDWYIAAADSGLVFDEKRDRLWDVAMERRLHDL